MPNELTSYVADRVLELTRRHTPSQRAGALGLPVLRA
jgi:hypothetical protein